MITSTARRKSSHPTTKPRSANMNLQSRRARSDGNPCKGPSGKPRIQRKANKTNSAEQISYFVAIRLLDLVQIGSESPLPFRKRETRLLPRLVPRSTSLGYVPIPYSRNASDGEEHTRSLSGSAEQLSPANVRETLPSRPHDAFNPTLLLEQGHFGFVSRIAGQNSRCFIERTSLCS